MTYDQKPIYCAGCGRKLKECPTVSFDTQTGKKISHSVDVMKCPEENWCGAQYFALKDGRWIGR